MAADWDDLRTLYIEEQLSIPLIAQRKGCSNSTIWKAMKRKRIPRRLLSEAAKLAHLRPETNTETPLDIQLVTHLYWEEGMSQKEIAEVCGVKVNVVILRMRKYCIPRRPKGATRRRGLPGILSPSWKGGRHKTTEGYILVYDSEHPRASKNHILEHIKVWEEHNGSLPEGFQVHHLNGIRDDNKLENLFAFSASKHTKFERGEPYKKRIRELETKLETV